MNIDQAKQVRGEGLLRFIVRLAGSWRVWVVAAPVVAFLLGVLEVRVFHTSKLFFCVGVLFLVCMFISATTLLVVGYIMPPPEPLSRRHALVNRLRQYFRVVLSGVMLGVAAFWGAIVSVDVSNAMKSSGVNEVMEVGAISVLYPVVLIAMLGLWVISMGLYIDICRTDPEVVVSRCEEVAEKCFGIERGGFRERQRSHRVMQVFVNCSTRSWWAFFVVYCFPLLLLFLLMFAWGWVENYFSSIVR